MTEKKVFIAYCHNDENIVFKITDKLKINGVNLWIDKNNIENGENILESILNGIDGSNLAVMFLSKATVNSEYFKLELNRIMFETVQNHMSWFLVKLDDVDVCDIMPLLNNYRYYDFSEENDIDNLSAEIINRINRI
jgi:hypothetical protein